MNTMDKINLTEEMYQQDPVAVIKEELKNAGKEEYSRPAVIEYLNRAASSYQQLQDVLKMIEFDTIRENNSGIIFGFYDKRIKVHVEAIPAIDFPYVNDYDISPTMYVNGYGVIIKISDTGKNRKYNEVDGYYSLCGSIDNGGILLNASDYKDNFDSFAESYRYYTTRYPELKQWYKDYYGVDESNIDEFSKHNIENFEKHEQQLREIEEAKRKSATTETKTTDTQQNLTISFAQIKKALREYFRGRD